MKILLRVVFLLLIVVGVVAQLAWLRAAHSPADDGDTIIAAAADLGLRVNPVSRSMLEAFAPHCSAPVRIDLLGLDATRLLPTRGTIPSVADGLYVFMGRTARSPEFARFYRMRVLADAAAIFGLRSTRAPSHIVHVIIPQSCSNLAGIDWTKLSPG